MADCVECFEITRHWMPGVVLLDMEMPIMSGFRVAQELRKLSHCTRVPIIAHTSLSKRMFWCRACRRALTPIVAKATRHKS
ncbi:hypothetical protein YK56LOC_31680 [Caballeronia sp. HLA56]